MGKVYLLDRSGAETDDKCGMAYYWNRVYMGIGMVPASQSIHLAVGGETHEDLSGVAESSDPLQYAGEAERITEAIPSDATTSQRERQWRRAGWLAAFALFVEPRIRAQWESVGVEDEIILDRSPLWVPCTPDRVLKHKGNGMLVYREYKTSITAGKQWLDSWKTAIQLHIGMKALEEELGQKVAYAQIMALMKGTERDGYLSHPYVWAYRSTSGDWTHEYAKARSAAWEPAPVWEYPGGIVEWVLRLGEEVALEQFPHTEPVFLNERMLDQWLLRKIYRMQEVDNFLNPDYDADRLPLSVVFEPRTNQCTPPFGPPCQYRLACWNASVNENPLSCGDYVVREPHHQVEINMRKETV